MDPMGNWGNNSLQVTGPKVNAADCRLRCHRRYRCRLPSEWSSFDVAHNVGGSSRNCAADWPKSPKLQSQNTCERELCGAGCVAWMPFDAIQTRFPLWLHAMWLVCLPSHVKRVIMECYLAHQLDTCLRRDLCPPAKWAHNMSTCANMQGPNLLQSVWASCCIIHSMNIVDAQFPILVSNQYLFGVENLSLIWFSQL